MTRRPTYVTVHGDSAGNQYYSEYDPRFTAPVKCWTVRPDSHKIVTLEQEPMDLEHDASCTCEGTGFHQ